MDPMTLLVVLVRAYRAYKIAAFAVDVGSSLEDLARLSSDDSEYFNPDHDSTRGEEQYLFVLGKITAQYAIPDLIGVDGVLNEIELRELIMTAVAETLEQRPTPEAYTTLLLFAESLGHAFETALPGVHVRLEELLRTNRDADLFKDPVYERIIIGRDGDSYGVVADKLGIRDGNGKTRDVMADLQRILVVNATTGQVPQNIWGSATQSTMYSGNLYSTNSTFFGIVAEAAAAAAALPAPTIRVLDGPHGMVLAPLSLVTPAFQVPPRPHRPAIGSVPQALADYYAARQMRRLGYVYVPADRQWAPETDITTTIVEGQQRKSVKPFDPREELLAAGATAAKAAVSKAVKKKATDLFKTIARKYLQKQLK